MKRQLSQSAWVAYFLVCAFGILIVIAFKPNFSELRELRAHYSLARQRLFLEEKKNYSLQKEFNGLSNDPEYIEEVAREKLGWCRPTETVYRFQTRPPVNKTSAPNN